MRSTPACASTRYDPHLMSRPVDSIRRYHAELKAIRQDLHAHPELAFEESRTACR